MQTAQRSNARATMRRSPQRGAPFSLEWRKGIVYIADPRDNEWRDLIPATIYRARVSPETIVNVLAKRSATGKPMRSRWLWTVIHLSPIAVHVDGGEAGTLSEAKRIAERAAQPFAQQERIWTDEGSGNAGSTGSGTDDGLPF